MARASPLWPDARSVAVAVVIRAPCAGRARGASKARLGPPKRLHRSASPLGCRQELGEIMSDNWDEEGPHGHPLIATLAGGAVLVLAALLGPRFGSPLAPARRPRQESRSAEDRKSTRLNSSHVR